MKEFKVHWTAIFFFIGVICLANGAPAIDTIWHKHSNVREVGLFESPDHVVILNAKNIQDTIYVSNTTWLIDFYANWCSHCQRFATVWKAFGHSIANWKDIINVGVFDCATADGSHLCRTFEVATVPTLKYFDPYSQLNNTGKSFEKSEIVEVLREKVINLLIDTNSSGLNLTPLDKLNPINIFDGLSPNVKYYCLIFDEEKSYLASSIILDLHKVSQIIIRRITSNNTKLCDEFKVRKFPTILIVDRQRVIKNLTIDVSSRIGLYNSINKFLQSENLEIDTMDLIDDKKLLTKYTKRRKFTGIKIQMKNDDIYQIDLDLALAYSLEHEISSLRKIHGDKMVALKKYLRVLVDYFPMVSHDHNYVEKIYNVVENATSFTNDEFHSLIFNHNITELVKRQDNMWIGCKGSLPNTRRYTCSLWTMFHTLTIKHAITTDKNVKTLTDDGGGKVIKAIYGYVKYFFGCSHCVEHFIHMAEEHKVNDVKTPDEEALWLWRVHNEVNLRLAGDAYEDPEFPKVQYPVKMHCPMCKYTNDTWNETEVLKYLKEKYGGSRIKYN